jgi:phosphinothricin acetyltransferase
VSASLPHASSQSPVPAPDRAAAQVVVRPGTLADLPAVLAIYTHYVLATTVTFNTAVPNPTLWTERMTQDVFGGKYHFLVAEVDGLVTGYVETSPLRNKPAYARSAEVSVYVTPDAAGQGIGGAMYKVLLPAMTEAGFHRAYAIVALPNDHSVRFHEARGFTHCGTLTEVGEKFGEWVDVGYWERAL